MTTEQIPGFLGAACIIWMIWACAPQGGWLRKLIGWLIAAPFILVAVILIGILFGGIGIAVLFVCVCMFGPTWYHLYAERRDLRAMQRRIYPLR